MLRLRLAAPRAGRRPRRVDELRGRPRRRRRPGDRGDDDARRRRHATRWCTEHAPLLAEAAETVADPQVRHRGTFGGVAGARRPGGRHAGAGARAGAEIVIAGPGGARTVAAASSSTTTSPPRWARTSCSSRCACPSTPAGARTTRSSPGSRSVVDRRRRGRGAGRGRHDRRGAGRADQHGLGPGAGDRGGGRRWSGSRPPPRRYARQRRARPRAPTPRATPTATPTTGGTSPGS